MSGCDGDAAAADDMHIPPGQLIQAHQERRASGGVEADAVPVGFIERRGIADDVRVEAAQLETYVRESRTRRALLLADVFALAMALVLTVTVIGADEPRPLALLLLPVAVLVAKGSGLYDRDDLVLRRSTLDELPRLFNLVTLTTLVAWLGEALVVRGRLGKEEVLGLWGLSLALVLTGRWTARRVVERTAPVERCLMLGDVSSFDRLNAKLTGVPGVELVALASLESVISDLEALRRRARDARAHRLVIAPPTVGQHEDVLNLVRGAKATGLRVSLVPDLLEVVGSAVEVDDLHGYTMLGLKRFGLSRSSRWLKRALDLAGATVALFALAPTMALIALLIRRDTPGPALYRQTRVGRDGNPFEILKFRTMVDGAHALRPELAAANEAEGLFKMADDPRVTRVGRRLRTTSLDELPQLVNVLRGEMSLVGPRPLIVDEDARVTGFDRRRLQLTPGMTGPWQVAGSARVPLHEMVKMDYLYVAGWSLWADVKIMLRTVPYMIARRGQ